jgi:methyltransferase-like protein/2-polyprenyl-3-methyl-5-hydroxy-6-metoxy-1,4-benzoquinol methylase
VAQNSYDAVPYEVLSYNHTHIAHLYLVGRLLGLEPPDFRRARVLELGCAAGGNILPMADQYRAGEFVGIDLSAVQIRQGQGLIAELGISNVTLRAESIVDFPAAAGEFDYIICHGTFSWVPPEVRSKILDITQRHLAPNGLAVISYNTLPGWAAVRGLRDMMLYHVASFPTPAEKITQARKLLQLIRDAQVDRASPYRALVEHELKVIDSLTDQYLFHEHLEENNQPFYFHEFVAQAKQHHLDYVCDTDLAISQLGNYASGVTQFLSATADPVRIEQYLDFVSNRRFRCSVVTQEGAAAKRAFRVERVEEFWLSSQAQPDRLPPDGPLTPQDKVTFTVPNGAKFTTGDDVGTALFLTLFRNRHRVITVKELVAEAKERYRLTQPDAALRRVACDSALRLFLAKGMEIRSEPGRQVTNVSARPLALPIARAVAKRSERVTNALHEIVVLNGPSRAVLLLLDGMRDRQALVASLVAAAQRGELTIQHQGRAVTDAATIGTQIGPLIDGALRALAENALLIG